MKIAYVGTSFRSETLDVIGIANDILEEFQEQGFTLTLRQLYYQFVARDLIPNTERSYKRLGGIVNNGRLAGLIDWDHLTDRTRNLNGFSSWASPADVLDACAKQFEMSIWNEQPNYIEVWVEKDALIDIVGRACSPWRVPYFSCRGYTSQSEMWAAGQRLLSKVEDGRNVVIFHLGDHDPSGIDMSRDIEDRLEVFIGSYFEFERLALSMEQVHEHNAPPNPAKVTDSRFEGYRAQYGDESWELDAMPPGAIVEVIDTAIENRVDRLAWDHVLVMEQNGRDKLTVAADKMREEFDTVNP